MGSTFKERRKNQPSRRLLQVLKLKQFLKSEDEDKKFIEKHRLGKGSRGGDAPKGCTSRTVSSRVSYSKGVRNSGGGVKHPVRAFFQS